MADIDAAISLAQELVEANTEIERLTAENKVLWELVGAVERDLPATLISGGLPRIKSALAAIETPSGSHK